MTHVNYELAPNASFASYTGADRPGADQDGLGGHLLVRISDNGRLEDHFKVVLSGTESLTATFKAGSLIQNAGMANYLFTIEMSPEDIELRNNSFTTKWQDLEPMVASNKLLVQNPDQTDATAEFRADWDAAKASGTPVMAALRWTLQAQAMYGFKLSLQGLPATARALKKDARLCADTTRGVELATWIATSPMNSAGHWFGPKPVLFARDVAAAQACFQSHPSRIRTGNLSAKH